MNVNQSAGWILVLGAIVLLIALNRIELLVILIPVSLLLAFVIGCSGHHETGLTGGIKKG